MPDTVDEFTKLFCEHTTAAAMLLHLASISQRLAAGDLRAGLELAIEEGGAWLDSQAGDGRDNMQTLMEQVVGLMNGHYCLKEIKGPIGIVQ